MSKTSHRRAKPARGHRSWAREAPRAEGTKGAAGPTGGCTRWARGPFWGPQKHSQTRGAGCTTRTSAKMHVTVDLRYFTARKSHLSKAIKYITSYKTVEKHKKAFDRWPEMQPCVRWWPFSACVHAHGRACMCSCVNVHACGRTQACICAHMCMHVCIHGGVRVHAFVCACMWA